MNLLQFGPKICNQFNIYHLFINEFNPGSMSAQGYQRHLKILLDSIILIRVCPCVLYFTFIGMKSELANCFCYRILIRNQILERSDLALTIKVTLKESQGG